MYRSHTHYIYPLICLSLFLLSSVYNVVNPGVIYRVKLSATRMASVKMANKETQSCDKKQGIGLEEDFKKLKLKRDETGLAKEGGKMKQEKTPAKKEEEKTTGIASKDEKAVVEVGPEEFLKHPLQVNFILVTYKPAGLIILECTCLVVHFEKKIHAWIHKHVSCPECLDLVVLQE